MKVPHGYCDLRVERVNDDIINTFIEYGYTLIAVNTTVNSSLLGVGNSNRKKRKIAECNGENKEENDWVPTPKFINSSSQNFKSYNILAVEPLNDQVFQDILTSSSTSSINIITCNIKTSITPKQYTIAMEKNIYFEVSYAPMLVNHIARQDTLSLAHLFHMKGKSKVKKNF
uniref:ACYPI51193 protein n=1 Tax=Acyrthosiphon pisum TaxID=7029 RepID=C4WX18_ACYPI|nr:ACYPI51193 [Acyrthosiphon pisum]